MGACRFPAEIEGSGVTEGYTGTKWEPVGVIRIFTVDNMEHFFRGLRRDGMKIQAVL